MKVNDKVKLKKEILGFIPNPYKLSILEINDDMYRVGTNIFSGSIWLSIDWLEVKN
jgi:hypothetical protein